MNTKQLYIKLEEQTLCKKENIKMVDENTISIDDCEIKYTGQGLFSITDSRGIIEKFMAPPEDVLEFFNGFYDALANEDRDAEDNDFYDKGFAEGMQEVEHDEQEEEEDEDDAENNDGEENG